MRWLAALVLAVLAGCLTASLEADGVGDDGAGGRGDDGAGAPGECAIDADCALAGASCCACPSFALPASRGWDASCDAVECPAPAGCAALVARCAHGACVAACAPIACERSCADGFAVDAGGCQVCACAGGPPQAVCQVDTDCARVPADCCGCARGGADIAVPATTVTAHLDGLMCPASPACPDVSTCQPEQIARCTGGRCALGTAGEVPTTPAGACGRPDLPACPAGTRCTLNSDEEATRMGLGTCRP